MMDGYAWGYSQPSQHTHRTLIFITPSLHDPMYPHPYTWGGQRRTGVPIPNSVMDWVKTAYFIPVDEIDPTPSPSGVFGPGEPPNSII